MQQNLDGVLVAIGILSLWCSSFGLTLTIPLEHISPVWIGVAILGRTFLHTGLFITAHDAMHSSSCPQQQQLHTWIGRIAVGLYAFLPYDQCCRNHRQHHALPGQVGDPDFHNGVDVHWVQWYRKFIGEYLSGGQLLLFGGLSLGIGFIFHVWCQVAWLNLVLFWGLPLILSSWQLFYFGTYLPHRTGPVPRPEPDPFSSLPAKPVHRLQKPLWLMYSFLSCYHFGAFHPHHHQAPQIPWYRLPLVHIETEAVAQTTSTIS